MHARQKLAYGTIYIYNRDFARTRGPPPEGNCTGTVYGVSRAMIHIYMCLYLQQESCSHRSLATSSSQGLLTKCKAADFCVFRHCWDLGSAACCLAAAELLSPAAPAGSSLMPSWTVGCAGACTPARAAPCRARPRLLLSAAHQSAVVARSRRQRPLFVRCHSPAGSTIKCLQKFGHASLGSCPD